ncbi:MAG: 30S ribosomal protein S21 [Saprospirales bacterium]|jgi:small subunit ribosomal protein S21|nr:30S ribosomal protein S21 [Saprospirales bacterium]MDA9018194.1 30S ribosomal protein S21 [Saprospiraceae bacterium]MDA9263643.1 30S ribosomal protein S21 [Saprospiraceae bacterium]MDA9358623.1 30S ribosomal protein S21 [Saprospiraceae bacterium]MDC1305896.1 30S ribosomal protein S21 [Saprospiraceae bacterium]|tara:strand:- start:10843 stop:11043 length:201 start_codon:yes stop_codon:yes gene_type:complete
MLIINVKDEESIDRALKRYKRKIFSTGIIKEVRKRKTYTKPSVARREQIMGAAYRLGKFGAANSNT